MLIDTFTVNNDLPGLSVAIWTPELEFERSVGMADIETKRERKIDDKIRIGSITKTFVASVVLQLVDEGRLSLDDPLSKHFPSYPNSENITLRQVLNMTSGIPDYLDDPLIGESFFYFRTNKFTPGQIFEATMGLPASFPPGKGWHYSNGNYNILGMLVEMITGNKLEDEISKRIIVPLNLVNTIFPATPRLSGQYSHGYMTDTATGKKVDVTELDPSITWAAGCMVSDFADLKKYVRALVKGEFFSKKVSEEHLTFTDTGIRDFAKYGLGIFWLDGFIGHNGGITGYNTMMVYNPELDATILASINEFGPQGGKVDQFFMYLAMTLYPDKDLFR